MMQVTRELIADMLIAKARSKIGVMEKGGNNKGKEVEEFQKAVDGRASREAWCMCFVQWVTKEVCKDLGIKSPLFPTEHCNTLYDKTHKDYLKPVPGRGYAFIQKTRVKNRTNGHTGFCENATTPKFNTVEGNTDPEGGSEGDGVYETFRFTTGTLTKTVRGYIDLPTQIYEYYLKSNPTLKPVIPITKPMEKPRLEPVKHVSKSKWERFWDSFKRRFGQRAF